MYVYGGLSIYLSILNIVLPMAYPDFVQTANLLSPLTYIYIYIYTHTYIIYVCACM